MSSTAPKIPQQRVLEDNNERAPFGGCVRLLDQYRQIGRSLLEFEEGVCGYLGSSKAHLAVFSTSVSFVPVEVLEGFLDDLLDLGVSDESLFIRKSRPALRAILLLVTCISALLLLTFNTSAFSESTALPLLLLVVFLAGLGSALYFIPRTKVLRRFNFATVVSREISQRRGIDKSDMGGFATRLLIREWWGVKGTMPAPFGSLNSDMSPQPIPQRVVTRVIH
jgi:hypothetical protein